MGAFLLAILASLATSFSMSSTLISPALMREAREVRRMDLMEEMEVTELLLDLRPALLMSSKVSVSKENCRRTSLSIFIETPCMFAARVRLLSFLVLGSDLPHRQATILLQSMRLGLLPHALTAALCPKASQTWKSVIFAVLVFSDLRPLARVAIPVDQSPKREPSKRHKVRRLGPRFT